MRHGPVEDGFRVEDAFVLAVRQRFVEYEHVALIRLSISWDIRVVEVASAKY